MKRRNMSLRRRFAVNPLLVVALSVVLLLALSVFSAFLIARNDARDQASLPGPDSGNQKDELTLTPVELYEQNGVQYAPLSSFEGAVKNLGDSVYELTDGGGNIYTFCADVPELCLNRELFPCKIPPILHEGELYLALLGTPAQNASGTLDVDAFELPTASSECLSQLSASLSAKSYFDAVTAPPEFSLDLSEYEKYMAPENRDGYLILANATHSLGKEFKPQNLLYVERARYAEENVRARLQEPAAKALDAFLREAYAQGYDDVTVTSGYRSYGDQQYRFNQKVNSIRSKYDTLEEAQAAAATVIQWPGKSEHQTGLACDMHNLPSADVSFDEKPAAKWLHENAHKFGFILRYPKDKTEVTGISFEPWHFRYVGRYHATRMHLLNLTLEEYVEAFRYSETNT